MATENHLKKMREEQGKTREVFAKETGVTRQSIYLIEEKNMKPTVEVALRFAKALGCSVEDIFELTDSTPTVLQRAGKIAKEAAQGVLASVVIGAIVLGGLLGFTAFSADAKLAAGDFMNANLAAVSVDMFLHPFTLRARLQALDDANQIHIGEGRGYLTPLPDKMSCTTWLNRYDALVAHSNYDDVFGEPLHLAMADCLDRVGDTEQALTERQAILQHPSYLLMRSDSMECYEYLHAALLAHLMGDDVAAQRLLKIDHDDHKAMFTKWFSRKGPVSTEIRMLRPIAATLGN